MSLSPITVSSRNSSFQDYGTPLQEDSSRISSFQDDEIPLEEGFVTGFPRIPSSLEIPSFRDYETPLEEELNRPDPRYEVLPSGNRMWRKCASPRVEPSENLKSWGVVYCGKATSPESPVAEPKPRFVNYNEKLAPLRGFRNWCKALSNQQVEKLWPSSCSDDLGLDSFLLKAIPEFLNKLRSSVHCLVNKNEDELSKARHEGNWPRETQCLNVGDNFETFESMISSDSKYLDYAGYLAGLIAAKISSNTDQLKPKIKKLIVDSYPNLIMYRSWCQEHSQQWVAKIFNVPSKDELSNPKDFLEKEIGELVGMIRVSFDLLNYENNERLNEACFDKDEMQENLCVIEQENLQKFNRMIHRDVALQNYANYLSHLIANTLPLDIQKALVLDIEEALNPLDQLIPRMNKILVKTLQDYRACSPRDRELMLWSQSFVNSNFPESYNLSRFSSDLEDFLEESVPLFIGDFISTLNQMVADNTLRLNEAVALGNEGARSYFKTEDEKLSYFIRMCSDQARTEFYIHYWTRLIEQKLKSEGNPLSHELKGVTASLIVKALPKLISPIEDEL